MEDNIQAKNDLWKAIKKKKQTVAKMLNLKK